jgi:hypothetical protein
VIASVLIGWTGTYTAAFAYAGFLALLGIGLAFSAPESNP